MAHDPLRQAYGQRRHLNNIYTTVCATIVTLEHQAKILRTFAEKTLADMAEIEARYGLPPLPVSITIPESIMQSIAEVTAPTSVKQRFDGAAGAAAVFDNRPIKE